MKRLLMMVVMTLSLGGCITVSNTLPVDQVAAFRLSSVDVVFAPDAKIWWGDAERAYAVTKGVPAEQSEAIANTDEARAYVRKAAADKIRAALEAQLKTELRGTRPIRIEVTVRNLMISSAIQRIIVGGDHRLTADVNVIDARTGKLLQAFPDQTIVSPAGQGLAGALIDHAVMNDPIDRVTNNFATRYAGWLLNK